MLRPPFCSSGIQADLILELPFLARMKQEHTTTHNGPTPAQTGTLTV
jgi:hypothetical protein